MRKPRTSLLAAMFLAMTVVVFVASSAAASPPKKTTKTKAASTTTTATTTTTPTTTSASSLDPNASANADGPGSHYSVINGTANAASDHVIVGSTAFPNYVTGAVDNYYSMAHSHVDNSPFAEGTASPLDTGPVGQTAAAGNFQQPQYADARWPGDDKSGKAAYGTQGQPYAVANASEYNATAQASEASNGLSGPSAPGGSNKMFATPVGFDGKLRQALAGWKAKWLGGVSAKKPAPPVQVPVPAPVPVPSPTPSPTGKLPTPPPPPVTTPVIPGVTTPSAPVGGSNTLPPPVTLPLPPIPRTAARGNTTTTPSRSLASSTSSSSPAGTAAADGESLLESSTSTALDPKTNALVTSGESRLGRVSLGGGQIVIEGIHVAATISNDGKGSPTYKVGVTVASATIGGVPVTIDQDGVHLAGQTQGLPYKQASDALNGALKQAGIQLFLVGPEIATNSCSGTGGGTGSTSTTTTTTSSNGTTASSNSCAPAAGMGTTPSPASSCDQTSTSPSTSTGQTTTSSTPSITTPAPPTSTTTKTTTNKQTTTTSTTSSCDQAGMSGSSSCTTGTTPTTTSSSDQAGTTTTTNTTTSSSYPTDTGAGTSSAGEMTITATGLHVVFTQPAGAPAGVPAQNTEHILGEVFLDSLAVPGVPFSAGSLDLNFNSNSPSSSSSSSSSGSSCVAGAAGAGGSKKSGGVAAGGLSAGGSNAAGSLSSSGSGSGLGSGYGSTSQPGSGSTSGPVGAALGQLASWVRSKPTWLLLAYLVWQALAVAAAASLWKWQGEGGAS